MSVHHNYMIVISILFALVFAVMIYSTIRHRRACAVSSSRFAGTSGRRQWFWTLVPLAILAFIDFSLISASTESHTSASQQHVRR